MPPPPTRFPSPEEFWTTLDRPPWHVASTIELADLMGVPPWAIQNRQLRRTGPPAEPPGSFIGAGDRHLYRLDKVSRWLGQGLPLALARRWLIERGFIGRGLSPQDADATARALVYLNAQGGLPNIDRLKWKPRGNGYRDRLMADLAVDDDATEVEESFRSAC